jgi:hypothetical protein
VTALGTAVVLKRGNKAEVISPDDPRCQPAVTGSGSDSGSGSGSDPGSGTGSAAPRGAGAASARGPGVRR